MIKAALSVYDEIKYIRFAVNGHAGSAEYGHDLVCAAASILLYAIAQTVDKMTAQGGFTCDPITEADAGDGIIACHCATEESFAEALTAFKTIWAGFELLARDYPQYVGLTYAGKA